MKVEKLLVGDKVWAWILGLIFVCVVAIAITNPKISKDSSGDRITDLEIRCLDLESEVKQLKRGVYDTSGRVNELETRIGIDIEIQE